MAEDCHHDRLHAEIEELRARLREAEETITAIREGQVDALVVSGPQGEQQLYTLQGAEHAYRLLVEAMNEGALVITPSGDIAYCNRTFAAMLNVKLEKMLGTSVYDYIAAEDTPELRRLLKTAVEHSCRAEIGLRPYGIVDHVPAYLSVGKLALDEVDVLSAVVTDLTQQKRAEAELQQYREHLEDLVQQRTRELIEANRKTANILESIGDGFIAFDKDWRFTYVNSIAEDFFATRDGYTRDDLIGNKIWDLFPTWLAARWSRTTAAPWPSRSR